ncbi:shikimate dehydrogenase [Micrococcales bacterium 31B]|nr:shikimate dehydrogenase [Micrococcales bacterium 31B]
MSIQRAAVWGSPIEHSLSPALHNAAYAELGLESWQYSRREVKESDFADAIKELDDSWRGLSLTMPLKRVALEVADEVTERARRVGAVNTFLRREDGGWIGDNTDVYGIVESLREAGITEVQWGCVLGGGATASSAIGALAELGCTTPTVYVRSKGRSRGLRNAAARLGVQPVIEPWDSAWEALSSDVVISTVPSLGADEFAVQVAEGDDPTAGPLLLDVVYDPWPTHLARAWHSRAGDVVGGFEMLLHQACLQVELMTGRPAPVEAMRRAGSRDLAERGVPGYEMEGPRSEQLSHGTGLTEDA